LKYWKEGYSKTIAEHSGLTQTEVTAAFESEAENASKNDGYFCWQSVVASVFV
jgi:hypothetical protein